MIITAKTLVQNGIVGNAPESCITPVGVDLQVKQISKIAGIGYIPAVGKTKLPTYVEVPWNDNGDVAFVELQPGVYDVVFEQSCNLPAGVQGKITHRSSLNRCGVLITSGEFDPGFHTDNIGAVMYVHNTIVIEKGARLAQIVCNQVTEGGQLYNGQWQGDCQRKENQ